LKGTHEIVRDNTKNLDSAIIYNRDFSYNYCVSYFIFIMQVAVEIHGPDLDRVIETYNLVISHTPLPLFSTRVHRTRKDPQLSSCFLVAMTDDSTVGIYDTLKSCAMISKTAGGIGLSIHCIRATGFVYSFSYPVSILTKIF